MKRLSYETLKETDYDGFLLKQGTERMLQFGKGAFLRGFVDVFVDEMNEKANFDCKIVVCQSQKNTLSDAINEQEGLYTLYLRGYSDGEKVDTKRVISSLSRCIDPFAEYDELLQLAKNPHLRFITGNTTEAGIVYDDSCAFDDRPPLGYPAKLTRFLYERFVHFNGAQDKGFIILPCELIDNNGEALKRCVLQYVVTWALGDKFKNWVEGANKFCSTLVDRIVTGYPRGEAERLNEQNGYVDELINTGEVYAHWVIEGDESIAKELPFTAAGLPIIITPDHKPYKQRKVRILNGAHTTLVLGAYLAGKNIVRECIEDDVTCEYMKKTVFDEIIPTLPLDKKELWDFASSVIDRFNNPFIDHELLSISLNCTSKWRARVLPSLLAYYEQEKSVPPCIAASFAFYVAFYRGEDMRDGALIARRDGEEYKISDDAAVLDFFYQNKDLSTAELVRKVCENTDFWGQDLTKIEGFERTVTEFADKIERLGCYKVMQGLLETQ